MAGDQSRENGRKGGRPKSFAALEAERQREYIAKRLVKAFGPIVTMAINRAKKGDAKARDWLTERAYGKSVQPISNDGDQPFKIELSEAIAKKNNVA